MRQQLLPRTRRQIALTNDNWNTALPQDGQRRCKCATPVNRPFGIGAKGPFGMIHNVFQKNVVLFHRTDRENDNIATRLGLGSGGFFQGGVVGADLVYEKGLPYDASLSVLLDRIVP